MPGIWMHSRSVKNYRRPLETHRRSIPSGKTRNKKLKNHEIEGPSCSMEGVKKVVVTKRMETRMMELVADLPL